MAHFHDNSQDFLHPLLDTKVSLEVKSRYWQWLLHE